MALLKRGKLGARVLRLGDRGRDVLQLHEFLRLQGYDLGEEDDYGYLTKDAVQQFQREYGLAADGIAGRRFFALILTEDLPIRRRIHVVGQGETLEQIAADYGIEPRAFGERLRGRKLYPGRRLLFFDREIWGICSDSAPAEIPPGRLTGLIFTAPDKIGSGPFAVFRDEFPFLTRAKLGLNSDLFEIHRLLRTGKTIKRTAAALLELPADTSGLYVPWAEIAGVDGRRYLALLKRLRRSLPRPLMLWVELGPGIPSRKVWGGLDYEAVNRLADRIVYSLPSPAEPGPLLIPEELERGLAQLKSTVYTWKILVKLPVYAVQWELDESGAHRQRLSYRLALSRAFRHGARQTEEEKGGVFYRYQSRGKQYQLRLPHYEALGRALAAVNRYNLAGVILDRLGMEDPRLWNILISYFRAARL